MKIQDYISSGIVESYVLGLANSEEQAEFERMYSAHTEVKEARDAFEISLEQSAKLNAVHPPKNLKSKIFAQIDIDADELSPGRTALEQISANGGSAESLPPKVITMGWQRYLAAASVILLLFSTALNFYFFSRYKDYNNKYSELLASQQQLVSSKDILNTQLSEYKKTLGWMKNPDMAIVKMPAVATAPDLSSATTVYWDTKSRDVYLMVNQLPAPAAGLQYQLWALVDGVPVDAGVFDVDEDGVAMRKMKNIPKAQAFAITLEKTGGSASPSMEKMYVMGKV